MNNTIALFDAGGKFLRQFGFLTDEFDLPVLPLGTIAEFKQISPDTEILLMLIIGARAGNQERSAEVFELIEMMSADSRFRTVPIVFLAPAGDHELKLACLRAGVAAFVGLPVSRTELALIVRNNIRITQEFLLLKSGLKVADSIQDIIWEESRETQSHLEDQIKIAREDLEKQCLAQDAMYELSRQELLDLNQRLKERYEAEIIALKEKNKIESLFGKYVSPEIVERVSNPEKSRELDGVRRTITVFFSDIRGFTSISESIDPEKVIFILNEFFTEMTEIIHACNGWVDKYNGDNIMALFGAPIDRPDHVQRAIDAACQVQKKFMMLKKDWRSIFNINAGLGIGIATGDVIVGNIGSFQKLSYTAIGDTVNVAARLESMAEDGSILIAESCYQALAPGERERFGVRFHDDLKVKGRTNPVKTYAILL